MDTEDGCLLESLRGLHWKAERPPARSAAGAHSSRSLGPAAELAERRAWRPGDEARRIDWRLLARTDRALIRLAEEPQQSATTILLDASASMGWPTETLGKWRQARRIALGLAAAAAQAGDPVGVSLDPHAAPLRPSGGPGTLLRIADLLSRVRPQGAVDLAAALARCAAHRLVVVSDFLGEAAETEALLAAAGGLRARGREIHAVHILDEAEIDPPASLSFLYDPENPEIRRSLDAAGRAAYRRRFAEWRADLAAGWRGRGGRYATVLSGEPSAAATRRIVRGEGGAR